MNILELLVQYLNGAYVAEYAPEREGKEMSKHTKGWSVAYYENLTSGSGHYSVKHGSNTICRIEPIPDVSNDEEKNAKLIASAPDLLEALKLLTNEIKLKNFNIRKDFSLFNYHANALKAIDKAEGNE